MDECDDCHEYCYVAATTILFIASFISFAFGLILLIPIAPFDVNYTFGILSLCLSIMFIICTFCTDHIYGNLKQIF